METSGVIERYMNYGWNTWYGKKKQKICEKFSYYSYWVELRGEEGNVHFFLFASTLKCEQKYFQLTDFNKLGLNQLKILWINDNTIKLTVFITVQCKYCYIQLHNLTLHKIFHTCKSGLGNLLKRCDNNDFELIKIFTVLFVDESLDKTSQENIRWG